MQFVCAILVRVCTYSDFFVLKKLYGAYFIPITTRKANTMNYRIEESTDNRLGSHALKLDERKYLSVTGVSHVDGFDEHTVVLVTTYGVMTVHGSELNINKLNIDRGCVSIDGQVDSVQYSKTDVQDKGSWLSRIFR